MSRLLGLRLLVLLCFASFCWAQFDTASVLGTVRDQTGGVVKESRVTLRNIDTGVSATTSTDTNGDFQFFNVRSYADLTLLSPGVRKSMLENQTTTSRDASYNVNGQRSALNNCMVDPVRAEARILVALPGGAV